MLVWQAHKARIRHMAFAPDGAELATTAGTSKFVWTWRAATGELAAKLAGHTAHARAVAYSPDGRFLASTQNTNATTVWDRTSGTVAATIPTPGWCIESVAFRPDSSGVAVATSEGALVWPTGDYVKLNQRRVKPHRFGPSYTVQRLLFSPCGRYLAVTHFRSFTLYDATQPGTARGMRTVSDPQGTADAAQFAFAPDGNTLAVVYGRRVHLFAMPHGEAGAVLRGHPNYIHALGFQPDGRAIVSAGADGIVRTWDPTTGAAIRTFDWGIGKVCAAAVSPDGMLCAAGGENGKVVVWDVDI